MPSSPTINTCSVHRSNFLSRRKLLLTAILPRLAYHPPPKGARKAYSSTLNNVIPMGKEEVKMRRALGVGIELMNVMAADNPSMSR